MRKIAVLFAVALPAIFANAQGFQGDTISAGYKYNNYIYGSWPESIYANDTIEISVGMPVGAGEKEVAQMFYAKDKIEILGVACGMAFAADTHFSEVYYAYQSGGYDNLTNFICQHYDCTTMYNPVRQEYARLYTLDGDTALQVVAEAPFTPRKDTGDLWMAFNEIYRIPSGSGDSYANRTVYFPIQEVYFDHPYSVSGTIYAGATECDTVGFWPVKVVCIGKPRNSTSEFCRNVFARKNNWQQWNIGQGEGHLLVFPIIARDTTHGIDMALSAADRYTTVSPNPATGHAIVAAGCGIDKVEMFDNSGRKVNEVKAEGLTVNLNIKGYASGVYVLHIHTPLGVAVKKLVVR